MTPKTLPETVSRQFRLTAGVFARNLDGVTDEQARVLPPQGGSSLLWVAGHIVSTRMALLELIGGEPFWSEDRRAAFRRGSTPSEVPDLPTLDELRADFRRSQEPVVAALAVLTPERLAEPATFSPTNDPEETVGTLLAALAFHESYHCGQLGVLRRTAGLAGAIG